MAGVENVGEFKREKVRLKKKPEPIGRRVTEDRRVRLQEQAVEDNNPRGGHRCVCEGDRARVGVSHGIVEVKLVF